MKRRDAIKTIVVLGASVFVPLNLAKSAPKPEVWFKENLDWLLRWFDHSLSRNHWEGMQIFKTGYSANYIMDKIIDDRKLKEHKVEILWSAIFQKGGIEYYNSDGGYNPIRWMSGFLEQTGRFPVKEDKVRFEYLTKSWLKHYKELDLYDVEDERMWVTECKLRVL